MIPSRGGARRSLAALSPPSPPPHRSSCNVWGGRRVIALLMRRHASFVADLRKKSAAEAKELQKLNNNLHLGKGGADTKAALSSTLTSLSHVLQSFESTLTLAMTMALVKPPPLLPLCPYTFSRRGAGR